MSEKVIEVERRVVVDYAVLRGYTVEGLTEKVYSYISGMWEPYGHPFSDGKFFYQGMVKYIYPPDWTTRDKK